MQIIIFISLLSLFLCPYVASADMGEAFAAQQYTLTVSPEGSGTITSSPENINCGSSCSGTFSKGKTIKLIAEAVAGYTFKSWGGACKGTTPVCRVKMSSDKEVTAIFALPTISAQWTGSKARMIGSIDDYIIGKLAAPEYYISGKLTLSVSDGNVSKVKVKLYLSDDEVLDQADTEIGLVTFGGTIKAGKSMSKNIKYKLGVKTLGKYLIAVIDPENEIIKANADNITAVSKKCINRSLTEPCAGCPALWDTEYCINLGYDKGCDFPDGTGCSFSVLSGQCGQKFSFCELQGGTIKHVEDSSGFSYGVCVFNNGSECLENDYFTGKCGPSNCKQWRMSSGGCIK